MPETQVRGYDIEPNSLSQQVSYNVDLFQIDTDRVNIISVDPSDTATFFGTNDSGESILHIRIGNGPEDKVQFETWDGAHASTIMHVGQDSISIFGSLNVTNNINGNASSASKLETARIISLGGDLSGQATFDGASDITISAEVANDSHTHDIRYYTKTISDARYIRTDTTDDQTIQSSLAIEGDLTVNGTTTTVNTETVTISDNIIVLNSDYTGSTPTADAGIEVERGTQTNYRFMFNEATDTFVIGLTGDEQAVATRQDEPAASGIPYWNNTNRRFDTISSLATASTTVPTNFTGSTTSGTEIHADSFHTNGLGAGQIYIAGACIDANNTIRIGEGRVAGQSAQNTIFGGSVTATSFVGNASSASKLKTARTISLTQDASGSVNFDGSSNVSLTTSVNKVRGVNFYTGTTNPTGTTRLNMDGYFYATRVYNAVYNDLAEFMPAEDTNCYAGDVLFWNKKGVRKTTKRAQQDVVGVYSDTFGFALGADNKEGKIPIAITGRVQVFVQGKIKKGQELVSYKDGKAVKANIFERIFKRNAIIGKALETTKSSSKIWILVK